MTYALHRRARSAEPLSQYALFLFAEIIVWWGFLYINGTYESFRTKDFSELFHAIFKSAFLGLLTVTSLLFFIKTTKVARDFVAFTFLLTTFLMCTYRALLLLIFHYLRKKGYNYRNVLVVGSGKRTHHFIDLVRKNAEWGLKIIGIVEVERKYVGRTVKDIPVIGTLSDIPDIFHTKVVDEVVFIVPRSWLGTISETISFCETEGVAASIALDFFDLKIAKSRQIDLPDFPLVAFETTPARIGHLVVKRSCDIVLSCLGIFVLALPLMLIAALIKLSSPGPVFFQQKRKGLNGRIFTLYKFRTMVHNAEAQLQDLKNFNEMEGPAFKLKNDPRVTKIGRILRKLSIDELPQLWNILLGDMSIIGPRPPLNSEVELYESWQRRRLSMRPGLTCLWQVNGRNKITDFKKWAELDLKYIDNWSLVLDLKIFLKTIPVVLFGTGAK